MPLDFPNNPLTNQVFSDPSGASWFWDGAKWGALGNVGSGGPFLPLSGGTLTGPLMLSGSPTAALHAVTKQYSDYHGVAIDAGVDPLGVYNQPARITSNTLAGAGAGARLTTTTANQYNTLFGYFAGNMLTDGSSAENTFIGYAAGMNLPSGNFNTWIGNGAGWGINYATSLQTFVGMDAFRGTPENGSWNSGGSNTGVGAQVMRNGNFSFNVAMGLAAMRYNNPSANASTVLPTVGYNVALGYAAMAGDATVTGTLNFNITIGWQSGNLLGTNGAALVQANTFVGHATGQFATNVSYDTFIGYNSGGSANLAGNFLTLVGAQTGENLTTATQVTGVGFQVGRNITTGNANDMFGYQAGLGLTTGNHNSIFGNASAVNLATGTLNTIIGPLCASTNLVSGNNNILIGYGLDTVASNTGSTINIGNAFTATNVGGPTNANGHITLAAADVAFSNALLGTTTLGVSLDVPNQLVTAIAVAAGGSGYTNNDTLNDASGGRYQATVTAGAVTALTIIKPGIAAAPPANPVTLTNGSKTTASNQTGSGCTATLTWSSNRALLLNKGATDVFVSSGALATSAVVGFLGLPACVGTPTGVPTNAASGAPFLIYNKTTNTINVYTGGGWQHVTLTAGAA